MPEREKDKFSFDGAPDKIGSAEGKGNVPDFSFDDVPVLGKKEKPGSLLDLLGGATKGPLKKKRPQQEAKEKTESADTKGETTVKDDLAKDVLSSDLEEWLDATPKVKKSNKKLIIAIFAGSIFLVVAVISVALIIKATKPVETPADPLPQKRLSKEDKEKARIEEENKKFEEALSLVEKFINDGDFDRAERKLAELQAQRPEKSAIYNLIARSQFKKRDRESALQNYIKAVSAGSETAEPYIQICSIYLEKQQLTEALDFSEKGLKKFPEDQQLLRISAKIALSLGNKQQAADLYGKTSKTELTLKELDDYALVLKAIGETKKAKEVYIYAGKKFAESQSFEKAVEIEPDPFEKNSIINIALSIFEKDRVKTSRMLILLVKELLKTGRKDMAIEKIKAIDPEFLNEEDSLLFLRLSLESSSDVIIKDRVQTIIATWKDNYTHIKNVQNMLINNGKNTLSAEIFSELWAKNPGNPIFEYFYAKSLDPMEEALEYYKAAISKKPNFGDALYDFGKCLIAHRRYKEAENVLYQAAELSPKNLMVNKQLFISKFYAVKTPDTLKKYRDFLETVGIANIASNLIEYAQQLEDPSYSEELIAELEKKKDKSALYWRIRHDIVYWKNPEKHFTEYYPPEARELYIAFLLAKGKYRDVLLLPTPPDKFPDFWKIFLLWRANSEDWQELATTFQEKNKANSSFDLIISLMLGKLDPEEARKQIYRVSHDMEAIFYLVLAEQFKRAASRIKAKVCYSKAAGDSSGIYKKAIQLFENN